MQRSLDRLRQRREQEGEGGFTLIELLIVIVILGILAAIVVFAVQNLSGTSAQGSCQTDYKTVETAAEAYKAQVGVYPGQTVPASSGVLTPGSTGNDSSTGIADLMGSFAPSGGGTADGPWLKDVPYNAGHYEIQLTYPTSATSPVESVYNTAATPAQIGTTNSVADCTSVS